MLVDYQIKEFCLQFEFSTNSPLPKACLLIGDREICMKMITAQRFIGTLWANLGWWVSTNQRHVVFQVSSDPHRSRCLQPSVTSPLPPALPSLAQKKLEINPELRWCFRILVHHILLSAGFLSKVPFFDPTTSLSTYLPMCLEWLQLVLPNINKEKLHPCGLRRPAHVRPFLSCRPQLRTPAFPPSRRMGRFHPHLQTAHPMRDCHNSSNGKPPYMDLQVSANGLFV